MGAILNILGLEHHHTSGRSTCFCCSLKHRATEAGCFEPGGVAEGSMRSPQLLEQTAASREVPTPDVGNTGGFFASKIGRSWSQKST